MDVFGRGWDRNSMPTCVNNNSTNTSSIYCELNTAHNTDTSVHIASKTHTYPTSFGPEFDTLLHQHDNTLMEFSDTNSGDLMKTAEIDSSLEQELDTMHAMYCNDDRFSSSMSASLLDSSLLSSSNSSLSTIGSQNLIRDFITTSARSSPACIDDALPEEIVSFVSDFQQQRHHDLSPQTTIGPQSMWSDPGDIENSSTLNRIDSQHTTMDADIPSDNTLISTNLILESMSDSFLDFLNDPQQVDMPLLENSHIELPEHPSEDPLTAMVSSLIGEDDITDTTQQVDMSLLDNSHIELPEDSSDDPVTAILSSLIDEDDITNGPQPVDMELSQNENNDIAFPGQSSDDPAITMSLDSVIGGALSPLEDHAHTPAPLLSALLLFPSPSSACADNTSFKSLEGSSSSSNMNSPSTSTADAMSLSSEDLNNTSNFPGFFDVSEPPPARVHTTEQEQEELSDTEDIILHDLSNTDVTNRYAVISSIRSNPLFGHFPCPQSRIHTMISCINSFARRTGNTPIKTWFISPQDMSILSQVIEHIQLSTKDKCIQVTASCMLSRIHTSNFLRTQCYFFDHEVEFLKKIWQILLFCYHREHSLLESLNDCIIACMTPVLGCRVRASSSNNKLHDALISTVGPLSMKTIAIFLAESGINDNYQSTTKCKLDVYTYVHIHHFVSMLIVHAPTSTIDSMPKDLFHMIQNPLAVMSISTKSADWLSKLIQQCCDDCGVVVNTQLHNVNTLPESTSPNNPLYVNLGIDFDRQTMFVLSMAIKETRCLLSPKSKTGTFLIAQKHIIKITEFLEAVFTSEDLQMNATYTALSLKDSLKESTKTNLSNEDAVLYTRHLKQILWYTKYAMSHNANEILFSANMAIILEDTLNAILNKIRRVRPETSFFPAIVDIQYKHPALKDLDMIGKDLITILSKTSNKSFCYLSKPVAQGVKLLGTPIKRLVAKHPSLSPHKRGPNTKKKKQEAEDDTQEAVTEAQEKASLQKEDLHTLRKLCPILLEHF